MESNISEPPRPASTSEPAPKTSTMPLIAILPIGLICIMLFTIGPYTLAFMMHTLVVAALLYIDSKQFPSRRVPLDTNDEIVFSIAGSYLAMTGSCAVLAILGLIYRDPSWIDAWTVGCYIIPLTTFYICGAFVTRWQNPR